MIATADSLFDFLMQISGGKKVSVTNGYLDKFTKKTTKQLLAELQEDDRVRIEWDGSKRWIYLFPPQTRPPIVKRYKVRLNFWRELKRRNLTSVLTRELAKELGVSNSTILKRLKSLEESGFISDLKRVGQLQTFKLEEL